MENLRRINLQRGVPGVFENTLSHNETLARMLAKLNEQTEVINDLIEEVEAMAGGTGSSVVVEDNLTSDSAVNALSAKQGKVLKEAVDGKQASGTYSTDIHDNIEALDLVSGTNTGDQNLSGLAAAADLAKRSTRIKEYEVTTTGITAITFSDLDINADGDIYEIEIAGINYVTNDALAEYNAPITYRMYVNADETETNYSSGATTVTNNASIGNLTPCTHSLQNIKLAMTRYIDSGIDDIRAVAQNIAFGRTGAGSGNFTGSAGFRWQYNPEVANINAITFKPFATGYSYTEFPLHTKIRVYKLGVL